MYSSLSPLLTTMKVFGLYFKRGTNDGEQTSGKKSHCRCNLAMIYAAAVLVLMWLDMIRMFSALSPPNTFGPLLFFKLTTVSWKILCVISQSTYFAVCYSGRLDRELQRIKLSEQCAAYSRRMAFIHASAAWVLIVMNFAFKVYAIFFTDGYMDIMLVPITTHFKVSDLLVPRIFTLIIIGVYFNAAWILPHTMSFMLAIIFKHRFQQLGKSFEKLLEERDEGRVTDSDIETFRQKHQKISMSVSQTDDFLMFHNAGAFCCQLLNEILFLYDLIFYRTINDPVVIGMRVFWMFGVTVGLCVTAAGGIMVNHYVSRLHTLNILLLSGRAH